MSELEQQDLAPLKVEIVTTMSAFGSSLFGWFLLTWLRAWILMLLLPAVTPWHLSYWQSVAALVLAWVLLDVQRTPARMLTDGSGK